MPTATPEPHADAQTTVLTVEPPLDPTAPVPSDAKRLKVPGATALIIGGVIGTGVFTLPSSLAPRRAFLCKLK